MNLLISKERYFTERYLDSIYKYFRFKNLSVNEDVSSLLHELYQYDDIINENINK